MKKLIITSCLFAILGSCEKIEEFPCPDEIPYRTTAAINAEKAERITEIICNVMNSQELIGIQVSIRDSLNESWNISLGFTDLKQKNDLEDHHVLRMGSVTKIYTSALILKLVELGYIELDQDISQYYPEHTNIRGVTIKNLLDHSSGIIDLFTIPSIFISSSNFPGKQWNPENIAKSCMEKELEFSPGSRHSYSNTNYLLLGLIAEKATNKNVSDLFSGLLLKPYNLNNTYFVPYMKTPSNLVNGYVHHFALSLGEWHKTEPDNTSWATVGYTAGAMCANSTDLSSFIHQLFHGEILEEENLQQMISFSGKYGSGLFRMNVNGRPHWGHEGEITGFESIVAYDPEDKITISICCNTTPFSIKELLNEIRSEL